MATLCILSLDTNYDARSKRSNTSQNEAEAYIVFPLRSALATTFAGASLFSCSRPWKLFNAIAVLEKGLEKNSAAW